MNFRLPPPSSYAAISLPLILGFLLLALGRLWPAGNVPWVGFGQEGITALAGVFLAAVALCERHVVWPRAAFFVGACATIPWLQWWGGLLAYRMDAWMVSAYLLGCGVCMVTAATLCQGAKREQFYQGWWLSAASAGVVACAVATWQWATGAPLGLHVPEVPLAGRVSATLGQPNLLATLLLLGVGATWMAYERNTLQGRMAATLIAWMGWGVVMTQSRTAWLFVPIALLWFGLKRRRIALRTSGRALALGSVLFVSCIPMERALKPWFHEGAVTVPATRSLTSGDSRLTHWATLLDASARAPWQGYGWNQVGSAQRAVAMDHPYTGHAFTHSHNLVVDLVVENGWPLGLLLAAIMAAWVWRQASRCQTREAWGLWLSVWVIATHAMFEYPLHYLFVLLPLGWLVGMLSAGPSIAGTDAAGAVAAQARSCLAPKVALGTLLGSLVALGGVIALDYMDTEAFLKDFRLARNRVGSAGEHTLTPPKLMLLDGWQALFDTGTRLNAPIEPDDVPAFERVAARFAYGAVWFNAARAHALAGQPAQATQTLRYLCHVNYPAVCDGFREQWAEFATLQPPLAVVTFPPSRQD